MTKKELDDFCTANAKLPMHKPQTGGYSFSFTHVGRWGASGASTPTDIPGDFVTISTELADEVGGSIE